MEKFIMAGGTALRYRDIGKGKKTILLIHGYLGSLEIWDDFAGQLGKNYRVISFDVPGHGISEILSPIHTMEKMAQIAKSLLDKIGVDKATIIGHSMGGYIAVEMASQFPEIVEGLVMFHSSPDSDTPERGERRLREIEIIEQGRKQLITNTHPNKMFSINNQKRFVSIIDEMSEQAMLTEEEGIIALLKGMGERKDMNQMLRNSNLKQLFIFGKFDQILIPERALEVANNNTKAQIIWLENSGHAGFIEEQALSLEVITKFIEE